MDSGKKWRLFRIFFTFIVLTALWFLFSGSGDIFSLCIGCLGALIMALLSYDVFIEEFEAARHSLIPRFFPGLFFILLLPFEMYKASFRVLRAVFTGGISPRVVHFRSRLKSDLARVVLAHSITFTPGTITMELDEDHYIVHWLFSTTRHSIRAGEEIKGNFEERIRRIWS
ncbi:Na+/H+ antiporter subunit E [Treponema sp. OttesenSCG-928-L16]|nr:Na+/H+ antiporter subunit E [Treponema sp. OttesenSCG-928-L16]